MNGWDLLREANRARRERVLRMFADEKSQRRLALIQKMQDNEGHLPEAELEELKTLQRHLNLPDDL